jgi:hypothetical protein
MECLAITMKTKDLLDGLLRFHDLARLLQNQSRLSTN